MHTLLFLAASYRRRPSVVGEAVFAAHYRRIAERTTKNPAEPRPAGFSCKTL